MGRRGPAPKPTRLKILAGNPGKEKLNANEPQPTAGVPTMPKRFKSKKYQRAKDEWLLVTSELQSLGLLTVIDRSALESYCLAVNDIHQCEDAIQENGMFIDQAIHNREGEVVNTKKVVHPAQKIKDAAMARQKQFLEQFGLSPSSRSRLQAPPPQDTADELDNLLNRTNAV